MACRNHAKGEAALKELQARKPQGTLDLLDLDVSDDDSIAAAVKKVEADFGRVDVLINNAGVVGKTPSPTRADLRTVFETNVFGPTVLTQSLLSLLQASKSPKVINVTSGLGSIGFRSDPSHDTYHVPYTSYRMSKAALNMLTACQYYEFQKFGCKVWAFCPGFVITDLTGKEERQWRKDNGADSSETSAQGILEIVEGKRDAEVGTFIARYGQQYPW